MTVVAELYGLQEVDLALDADRSELEDVQSRLGESEELDEARRAAEERKKALREAEHTFKEHEAESDELRRKLAVPEKKLYEGTVSSPKELEDLQREVDSLKRRGSALEDEALAAMEAQEEAQHACDEAQRDYERLLDDFTTEQGELRERETSLKAAIVELEERRSGQATKIDPALLGRYDELRAKGDGRAVAKVERGACQGCRISLPVNLPRRARSGAEIVQCINCQRILYVSG